jgi:hypothetical protein
VGVLPNPRLEVPNGVYTRFPAPVGVDDSATDRDQAVTFLVYGDGKLLGQSPPLKVGQSPQALSVEVGGVKLIELVARGSRPSQGPQPVTWGEAALRR